MKFVFLLVATVIFTFLVISNLFFNSSTSFSVGERIEFQTKNKEFEFTSIPSKGLGFEEMENKFTTFKKENPQYQNLKLYRTTPKNILKIKKWVNYKVQPEWKYPYLYFWI